MARQPQFGQRRQNRLARLQNAEQQGTLTPQQQQRLGNLQGMAQQAGYQPPTQQPQQPQQPGGQQLPNYSGWDASNPQSVLGGGFNNAMAQNAINMGMNRPNQQGPGGSTSWTQDPDTGQWTQQTSLSGGNQQVFDTAGNNAANALGGMNQNPFSIGNIQGLANMPAGGEFDRSGYERQLMGRFDEVNQPRFDQAREQMRSSLINSGVPMGSQRWNDEMSRLDQQQQDARSGQMAQAMQMSGVEQERGQNLAMGQRNQLINESLTERGMPLSEAQQLMNIQGAIRSPSEMFSPYAQINAADTGYNSLAGNMVGLYGDELQRAWQGRQNNADRLNRRQTTYGPTDPTANTRLNRQYELEDRDYLEQLLTDIGMM